MAAIYVVMSVFIGMAAATSLSPAQRSQRASIAALSRWSREDTREGTKPARSAFLARFEPDVPSLSDAERRRRAEAGLRAYMQTLAFRSSRARARR